LEEQLAVLDYLLAVAGATPWLSLGAFVAGLAAPVLARPVGHRLAARPWHAGGLVLALAGIVLFTLTPSGTGSLVTGAPGGAPGFCALHLAAPAFGPGLDERALNTLLFVPAGLLVGLLAPRTRWPLMLALLVLPVAIEAVQYLAHAELGRSCQAQDVVQNASGAVFGGLLGMAARIPLRRVLDPRPVPAQPEWATAASSSTSAR
jgi:hypothetical protein